VLAFYLTMFALPGAIILAAFALFRLTRRREG